MTDLYIRAESEAAAMTALAVFTCAVQIGWSKDGETVPERPMRTVSETVTLRTDEEPHRLGDGPLISTGEFQHYDADGNAINVEIFEFERTTTTLVPVDGWEPVFGTAWLSNLGHRAAFDPVGRIVDTPAVVDESGTVTTPATFKPGWHANIRLLDASLAAEIEASGLVIDPPANPARVWA